MVDFNEELDSLILSPDIVFFRSDTKVVAFNRRTLSALTLDEDAEQLLVRLAVPGGAEREPKSSETIDVIRRLSALSFLEVSKPTDINSLADLPILSGPTVIDTYRIVLTEACDLRCTYCFQNTTTTRNLSMASETLERSIDAILGRHSVIDHINIHWFGGEPLLKFKLIEAGVIRFREAVNSGRLGDVSFDITTHGGLITERIAAFLAENQIRVLVSLDGGKELNDLKRVDRKGRSTYEAAVTGYRALQRAGVDVGIIVTSTLDTNTKMTDGIQNILDLLNPNRIHINTPQPTANGWAVDGKMFAEQLFTAAQLCTDRGVEVVGPHQKIRRALMLREAQNLDCVAPNGSMAVSIGPSGQLGYCIVSWNGVNHAQFGKTWDFSRAENWKTHSHKSDVCRRCPAENVCGGPCPLEAELVGLDPQRCAFYLTTLEKVLLS